MKREGTGLLRKLFMNSRYALHYPEELLWALPFSIYKNLWKWKHAPTR